MITYSGDYVKRESGKIVQDFYFKGLSSDDKPIGKYDQLIIENGSIFQEIDTGTVSFYDRENETWCVQS